MGSSLQILHKNVPKLTRNEGVGEVSEDVLVGDMKKGSPKKDEQRNGIRREDDSGDPIDSSRHPTSPSLSVSSHSPNVTARIKVQDVNEHAPEFTQASYKVEAEEGRLYPELLTVTAADSDCSPKFGDVCKYEILNDDAPFIINSEGILKNTEPLNYERSHNHILSVVAYDCGMRRSEPVMVNIKVNRVCHIGWKAGGISGDSDSKLGYECM
ncbi:unnamed protein product [Notodromas monacha]|uniref:Cadherin domain-containing protein n=1 Tax=Notodromas monacha TaxID=399045 RepID=A0A7R9GDX5_9CRUS|nr:unnamed protein product [Notodromas monacha]CAG0917675.1 unnamed protein product [Notodromas monacha]